MASELGYPVRSTEEIEQLANRLLSDYANHIGSTFVNPPIPVEDIAEHYLGYSIEITNEGLFSDPQMLGGIDFDQMLILANVSVEQHDGRYSFTVAHEIGHHVLHRELFLKKEQSGDDEILCRDTKQKPQIEKEADRFAAALLMPSQAIHNAIQFIDEKSKIRTVGQARGLAAKVVKEGRFENVSNSAMINRLIDFGAISESIGYQNGRYRRYRQRPSVSQVVKRTVARLKFWK